MTRIYLHIGLGLLALSLITGCASNSVRTTQGEAIIQEHSDLSDDQLLDVGVHIFDPGLDNIPDDEDALFFPEVRQAEARYFPILLAETIQLSAAWGAVRVIPGDENTTDIHVAGEIVHSDGELLILRVRVRDSSGQRWYQRDYKEFASRYHYDNKTQTQGDPFQNIYNRISNDLLKYKRQLEPEYVSDIRTISALDFARDFSPEAFDGHLETDKKGLLTIRRLPAESDPMWQRINSIRERDHLFIDTLQDHYVSFSNDIAAPYQQYRQESYHEAIALKKLERTARNRTIAGIAAIIGGIAAAGSNEGAARVAGQVAVAAGGWLTKSGFDKRAEAGMHREALQELGDSLEAQIEPQVIDLEDRTITLTGSVRSQYEQWQDILREMYQLEQGDLTQLETQP